MFIHQNADIHHMRHMSRQAVSCLHFMSVLECPAHVMGIFPSSGTEITLFLFHTEILFTYGNFYWFPFTALSTEQSCIMSPSHVYLSYKLEDIANCLLLSSILFLQNCQLPNCTSSHSWVDDYYRLYVGTLFVLLFSVYSCNFSKVF